QNLPLLRDLVKQKQQEYNLGVVEVYSAQREELVRVANPNVPMGGFTNPDSADINAALSGKSLTRISPAGKADLIRGIVPIHSNWNPTDVVGVVVVNYYVPYSLVGKVKEIKGSIRDFIRLKEMRRPVTTGYILTLFLITLVIIILAIGFGLHIAKTLTVPIQELAEATRKVAEGDLAVHLTPQRDDELGYLVQAFNRMTDDLRTNQQQLKVRTEEVISSNQELEERRRYMEIVLKNVTAGVISVDQNGTITTINTSAERLLGIEGDMVGRNFREVLRDHQLEMMRELLRDMLMNQQDALSKEVTVPLRDGKVTLLLNVTFMKDDNGEFLGTVVVFDDLSQLIKAQRMAAWREVARRIAHEIKNPLTPIQLSAQRLRRRYLERFGPDDRVFDDCTAMIIGSVEELKTLVNEFSNFARLPAAHPSPCSLNDLVREAVTLFSQAHRQVDFRLTLDELAPTLQLDRDQIKRVLINLLDNAVAAVEEEEEKRVDISTAFNRELKMVTLVVADTGHGIAVEDRAKLFEPYFSTKKTGTGLGLAIVNTIITDHQGFIRVRDNEPRGTRFIVELPVTT
ncbi:MAG TPA: ATP-binding protein, partial [Geobacterales bacterium]|nr:ATP-binding protein [Geobacterales bacterium]